MLLISDLAVEEASQVLRPAFYSGFRTEYFVFDHRTEKIQFESKSGIKSNFKLIEIQNEKQNTHVMRENIRKLPCPKSGIKGGSQHVRNLLDSQIRNKKQTPRVLESGLCNCEQDLFCIMIG